MPAFITFGRILFAVLFIYLGATKLFDIAASADSSGVFEIIAGLMIALNFGARFFSILLIIYLAAATYYLYDFWDQTQPENSKALIVDALKNLSLIGGLFMIAGHGPGPRTAEPAYGDA